MADVAQRSPSQDEFPTVPDERHASVGPELDLTVQIVASQWPRVGRLVAEASVSVDAAVPVVATWAAACAPANALNVAANASVSDGPTAGAEAIVVGACSRQPTCPDGLQAVILASARLVAKCGRSIAQQPQRLDWTVLFLRFA